MKCICFYWNFTVFSLWLSDFQGIGWNLPVIRQPFSYGTDVQSCSAVCTVALAKKTGSVELTSTVFMYLHHLYLHFGFVLTELFKSFSGPLTLGRQWKVSIFCWVLLSRNKWFQEGGQNVLMPLKAKDRPWHNDLGATDMFHICSSLKMFFGL